MWEEYEYKFYPDGTAFITRNYTNWVGEPDTDTESFEWEILEDKTMVFDGDYYDYGDWYISDGEITMGDEFILTKYPEKYSD